jgi:peptidoglycan hydrolase-like protein with peptidoglycan-binding domain
MKTKHKSKPKTKAAGKQQKKKIIVASIAVGAAGILGYFGWQYLKKKREAKKKGELDDLLKSNTAAAVYNPEPVYIKPKTNAKPVSASAVYNNTTSAIDRNTFPLRKGSKGTNVKLLQQALIAKYGKTILPKYGADGDFGTETLNALKKIGLPATIDESTFNVLVQGTKVDPSALGKDLYNATIAKNFPKVLSLLKQIQTTDEYKAAGEIFKQYRINGVRQTIVNALLNTFTTDTQKQQIKFEFLRMGLQFDGSKWSLSGFDGRPIVTKENTTVWVNAMEGVKVPPKMVLGNEVSKRLDYTLFENNGKYFLVNTNSVNYLN